MSLPPRVATQTPFVLPKEIFVGNPLVRTALQGKLEEIFAGAAPQAIRDPFADGKNLYIFGRDWRVILNDGTHLIPNSSIDLSSLNQKIRALLPLFQKDLILFGGRLFGTGFERENNEKAVSFAEKKQIVFKVGKSCVEGGNCFLFTGVDGSPKAIVGIISILITMLSAKEQSSVEEAIPDNDWIRRARNLENLEKECEFFLSSPTVDDCTIYHQRARQLYANFQNAKKIIAEELRLPLKDIAFVHQSTFHIDFDLCVIQGEVFLHNDESIALDNKRELEKIGCKVHFVQGRFSFPGKCVINFFNGISLQNHFITNSAPSEYKHLEEAFQRFVTGLIPSVTIDFLALSKWPMSRLLTELNAGVRCFTWYNPSPL